MIHLQGSNKSPVGCRVMAYLRFVSSMLLAFAATGSDSDTAGSERIRARTVRLHREVHLMFDVQQRVQNCKRQAACLVVISCCRAPEPAEILLEATDVIGSAHRAEGAFRNADREWCAGAVLTAILARTASILSSRCSLKRSEDAVTQYKHLLGTCTTFLPIPSEDPDLCRGGMHEATFLHACRHSIDFSHAPRHPLSLPRKEGLRAAKVGPQHPASGIAKGAADRFRHDGRSASFHRRSCKSCTLATVARRRADGC